MTKPSDVKTAQQTAKKEITFTKAGPNSRTGGKNRGQNGESRNVPMSVLEQRRQDALDEQKAQNKAKQERKQAEKAARVTLQVELALKMIDDTTEFQGRKVSDDAKIAGYALVHNFREASVKPADGLNKNWTARAEEFAAMQVPSEILTNQRRYNDVQLGFRLAKTILTKAFDAAKATRVA